MMRRNGLEAIRRKQACLPRIPSTDSEMESGMDIDLGRCCCCESTEDVRNILMMPFRSPEPGIGCWSCFVCRLPTAGAVSVVCDRCLAGKVQPRVVCLGEPGRNRRAPIQGLEPFDHDPLLHEGEM